MIRFYLVYSCETGDLSELRTTIDTYYNSGEFKHSQLMTLVLVLLSVDGLSYPRILVSLLNMMDDPALGVLRIIEIANSVSVPVFKDYFLELKKADYLEACLLYCYVHSMRERAIRAFAKAKFTTSAEFLKHFLSFDSENSTLTYL